MKLSMTLCATFVALETLALPAFAAGVAASNNRHAAAPGCAMATGGQGGEGGTGGDALGGGKEAPISDHAMGSSDDLGSKTAQDSGPHDNRTGSNHGAYNDCANKAVAAPAKAEKRQ